MSSEAKEREGEQIIEKLKLLAKVSIELGDLIKPFLANYDCTHEEETMLLDLLQAVSQYKKSGITLESLKNEGVG